MRVARLKEAYPTARGYSCGARTSTAWASSRSSARYGDPGGREAAGEGPPALRMDLPLRFFCAPENRRGPLADTPHRERGGVLPGPGKLRPGGGAGKRKRILLIVDQAG